MEKFEPSTYAHRIAESYDELYPPPPKTHPMIETLARLAGGGPVLELGIGTGRIALPLASNGLTVHGIETSEEMIEKLRAKPGGESISVTIGDFANVDVPGRYSLIYVVFNTFFALTSQEEQVRCFANCASHLAAGGAFLIEAFCPDPTRYNHGQEVSAIQVNANSVSLVVTLHDPVRQALIAQQLHITTSGLKMYPAHLRYAYPSELDLMARLAGLRLHSRSGGWQDEPYVAASNGHVSIYKRLT